MPVTVMTRIKRIIYNLMRIHTNKNTKLCDTFAPIFVARHKTC